MRRTQARIVIFVMVAVVASLVLASTASAGWTWSTDGWTWDGPTPTGWTWDSTTA